MRFLGDVVIVEHIGKNIESSILYIPDDAKSKAGGIRARVIAIGEKFPFRDELSIGDVVIVPEQLGSRGRVPEIPQAIVYDGEDVLAKVS